MKHIKKFESYSSEEKLNEEFIGRIIKYILSVPIAALAFIVMQFMDPRKLKDMMLPKLIDIYDNIDILIDTLENIHFNKTDITDDESKAILEKLNNLKKVKRKWPTLELYKKNLCKYTSIINFKNRKYLRDQIEQYIPKKMTSEKVLEEIQKVYKMSTSSDIIGETRPRVTFQDRLNGII